MRIGLIGLVLGLALQWSGAANAQVPPPDAKSLGGKLKCAINMNKGTIGCDAKAEKLGIAPDSTCLAKVSNKFDVPVTGCMAKAELKLPPRTTGDTAAIEAKIQAFAASVRTLLHTTGGVDACSAAKDKCVINYVGGTLGCRTKAYTKGLGIDSLCVAKVGAKFTNGSNTGCMDKADLKVGLCTGLGSGNTGPAQALADSFIDDVDCELATFPTGSELDITTGANSGTCGVSKSGGAGGSLIQNLTCGFAYAGDGVGDPAGTPGAQNALNRYGINNVSHVLFATADPGAPNAGHYTCTSAGCPFGPPRPTPNNTGTSSCVHVLFTGPATGTVNTCHGSIGLNQPLQANIFITANMTQPCPLCVAGQCDATSSNPGAACVDQGGGQSVDCGPNGINVQLNISTPNSGTGSSSATAVAGKFCPSQGHNGCFGSLTCDYYEENGSEAGKLSAGSHSGVTASTFCIPATGNGLIDGNGGFPGPGANSSNVSVSLLP
jgi:hypothetical protein